MPRQIRGDSDPELVQILHALGSYEKAHPSADIVVYRRNPAIVRIRVIDPDLAPLDRGDRFDQIWDTLGGLPEDVLGQISLLLPLAPEDVEVSIANYEFDHPVALEI